MHRRLEGVESEVQYLRRQLDEMRELLQQAQTGSTFNFQESNNPHQQRDQQSVHRASASTRQHESHGSLVVQNATRYGNGQAYEVPMSSISPGGLSAHSHYGSHYEPPNIDNIRPLKRKRSCFEIRDDAIADFIDKGLITPECAVSCFNTYVASTLDSLWEIY